MAARKLPVALRANLKKNAPHLQGEAPDAHDELDSERTVAALDPYGPDRFHLMLEVARIAYAVRDTHIADLTHMRVPVADLWTAKRVLDQGVLGVMFPFCSTPQLAARAADATHYPPRGKRGSGAGLATFRWPAPEGYYDFADENILTICVIEEETAVNNIDEIAATPGVDVLFIGTSDLSFSMGFRGEQGHPRHEEAIERIVAAGKKHGKYLGRPAMTPAQSKRAAGKGSSSFKARRIRDSSPRAHGRFSNR